MTGSVTLTNCEIANFSYAPSTMDDALGESFDTYPIYYNMHSLIFLFIQYYSSQSIHNFSEH